MPPGVVVGHDSKIRRAGRDRPFLIDLVTRRAARNCGASQEGHAQIKLPFRACTEDSLVHHGSRGSPWVGQVADVHTGGTPPHPGPTRLTGWLASQLDPLRESETIGDTEPAHSQSVRVGGEDCSGSVVFASSALAEWTHPVHRVATFLPFASLAETLTSHLCAPGPCARPS